MEQTNASQTLLSVRLRPPGFVVTVCYMTILFAGFAAHWLPAVGLGLTFSVAIFVANLTLFDKGSSGERQAIVFLFVVLTLSLPVAAWRSETAIFHYIVEVLMLGVAFALSRDRQVYIRASFWLLLIVQAFVLQFLARNGVASFPLERLIPGSSSNGITSYLVLLQANYCIARYAVERRATFVTPLITLVICIVGYGRGSLLGAAAIIVINILTIFSPKYPGRMVVLFLSVVVVIFATWIRYGDDISLFVQANTKIGSGLYDSNRDQQIHDYIGRLDGPALIFGADYNGLSIERLYNNNPHNSYIRAHHIFGLIYLMTCVGFIFLANNFRRKLADSAYIIGIFGIVLLRAATEPIIFPTMLDVFFFGAAFCCSRPPIHAEVAAVRHV